MPTAAYYTLGCKVNQYETERIRREMERRGFLTVPFASRADVYVINSCTVTAVADSKSRKAIRAAARRNPAALVVATGCYAHLRPDEIRDIPGVDLVVSNQEKDMIPDHIIRHLPEPARPFPVSQPSLAGLPRQRTRAIVKVQDGCDSLCAYCAVPLARSVVCSTPHEDVLDEIRDLAACGYKEVVLTGIRLGRYESGGLRLPDLVASISGVEGIERVRLSSIEPMEVTEVLLRTIVGSSKVCRHLHVPLQSGDDNVLRGMNRPYTGAEFARIVRRARELVPEIGLTTDAMVGFPGETEEAFARTLELVEKLRFSRLHAFRFSPRPGTAAEKMAGCVSRDAMDRRSRTLIALGEHLMQAFAGRFVGRTVEVLVEGGSKQDGVVGGFTDNYVETVFRGGVSLEGRIVKVRIERAHNGRLVGELASKGGSSCRTAFSAR